MALTIYTKVSNELVFFVIMRSKNFNYYSSIAYLLLICPKLSVAQLEVSNKQQICK